ncbi:guanine nucleotide binding protein, alpha subunit [Chytriomyces sp. MP71]|nr:guanine nucleotide binding protein, alpha subunit [Chytriomyces sp. MP71]
MLPRARSIPLPTLKLGAGESGKSTVLKQMKLIYGTGFTAEETLFFRNAIILNLVTSVQTLLAAMHRLRIPFAYDPESRCVPGLGDIGSVQGSSGNVLAGYSQRGLDGGEGSGVLTRMETLKDTSGSDSSGLVEEIGQSTSILHNVKEDSEDDASRRKSDELKGLFSKQDDPTARMAAVLYHRLQKVGQKCPVIDAVQLMGRTTVNTYGYVKGSNLDAAIVEAIKSIWADSGVQYCYSRSNEFHLMDCCA